MVHDFIDGVGLIGGLVRWLKRTYLVEKRWEYVGLLRRGLETEMGDSEEVFEVSERERESVCVWETNEMAKNERALKMKRDKKIEEKFRTR